MRTIWGWAKPSPYTNTSRRAFRPPTPLTQPNAGTSSRAKNAAYAAKICQAGAIDYKQEDQIIDVEAGAIILATGYELFDARKVPEYGYGRHPNVVTALEFERFLSASGPTHGHVYRPSDLAVEATIPELEKPSRSLDENSRSSKRLLA